MNENKLMEKLILIERQNDLILSLMERINKKVDMLTNYYVAKMEVERMTDEEILEQSRKWVEEEKGGTE